MVYCCSAGWLEECKLQVGCRVQVAGWLEECKLQSLSKQFIE